MNIYKVAMTLDGKSTATEVEATTQLAALHRGVAVLTKNCKSDKATFSCELIKHLRKRTPEERLEEIRKQDEARERKYGITRPEFVSVDEQTPKPLVMSQKLQDKFERELEEKFKRQLVRIRRGEVRLQ